MGEEQKRSRIRSYFDSEKAYILLGVAGFGIFLLWLELFAVGALLAGAGAVLFGIMMVGCPTEPEIDNWYREDLAALKRRAMERLGLEPADLSSEPLVIAGPILWETQGIPNDELMWRRGRDGVARFSVWHVTIIFLTEHFLNSYSCNFNFLRNVALGELDSQFHYSSVVAVSMGELAQSYTLKTGQKLVRSQTFSLSFTDGKSINVVVSAKELKDLTRAQLPTTGVEKAVSTIKAMLRSKI